MGQIVNNQWEIVTKMDYDFDYKGNRIEVIGLARVEYRNDETEQYIGVDIPDPEDHPNITMRIRLNGEELTEDRAEEFNTIYDLIVETLESEICPDKTDLTNADFEGVEMPELDELMEQMA